MFQKKGRGLGNAIKPTKQLTKVISCFCSTNGQVSVMFIMIMKFVNNDLYKILTNYLICNILKPTLTKKGFPPMYSINELVKITGIPASTLRYYEQVGILPEVKRNVNGRREYNEKVLEWLELVVALKDTGMTIEEIKSYTELILQGDDTLDVRRDFLTEHKKNVEISLAKKQYHLEKIIRKIAVYDVLLYKKRESSGDLLI